MASIDENDDYNNDEPEIVEHNRSKITVMERLTRMLYLPPGTKLSPQETVIVDLDMTSVEAIRDFKSNSQNLTIPEDLVCMFAWSDFQQAVKHQTGLDVIMPEDWELLNKKQLNIEDMNYAVAIAFEDEKFVYVVAWKKGWTKGSGIMYWGNYNDYQQYKYFQDHPEELETGIDADGFEPVNRRRAKGRRQERQKGKFKLEKLNVNTTFAQFLISYMFNLDAEGHEGPENTENAEDTENAESIEE